MAQSWGRSTLCQSPSSNAIAPAGRKFPVFWKLPLLPLPKPKSLAGSSAFPKWKRQPKSSRRRSRPEPALEATFWLEDSRMALAAGGLNVSAAASIVVPSGPIPWTAAAAGTRRPVFNTSRRENGSFCPLYKPYERDIFAPVLCPRVLCGIQSQASINAPSDSSDDAPGSTERRFGWTADQDSV